ncbi:MAG: squalene--hopene cyclase [Planctomycetes bacterium]|nr:squalene--hopene cyclase [Planctomycetota bacterium]
MRLIPCCLALLSILELYLQIESAHATDGLPEAVTNRTPHADEEIATSFSAEHAARYLDNTATRWQKKRQCGSCHTSFAYLLGRPALESVRPSPPTVRAYFERMIEVDWPTKGPRWTAEVVCVASTFAVHDAATTGKLSPSTLSAFDRMFKLQRDDGGWDWLRAGWPPFESDEHYGVTLAAIGLGTAPDDFAGANNEARACVDGIRRYLSTHRPASLHQRAMGMWASIRIDGILSADGRRKTLEALLREQRPDGGWALATLIPKTHKRLDNAPQDFETSDGYGTGFVVYVARLAGVPREDVRLQRGIAWLKTNQRVSGRWFTRSPTRDSRHFISNAGTAYAALALAACGEMQEQRTYRTRRF